MNTKTIIRTSIILLIIYLSIRYLYIDIERFTDSETTNTEEEQSQTQPKTECDASQCDKVVSDKLQLLNDKMLQDISNQITSLNEKVDILDTDYDKLKSAVDTNTTKISDAQKQFDNTSSQMPDTSDLDQISSDNTD